MPKRRRKAAAAVQVEEEELDASLHPTVQDLLKELPRASVRQSLEALMLKDPYLWTVMHRRLKRAVTTYDVSREIEKAQAEGRTLSTIVERHRPFLVQPLSDKSEHKVYKKGRQVGVSELGINEVLWFLSTHPGTKFVYCVPEEAEILTRRGWQRYHSLDQTDQVLTLDPVQYISRWEKLEGFSKFDWDGPLEVVGPFHCTPEHRWPTETRLIKIWGGTRGITRTHALKPHLHKIPRHVPHEHDRFDSLLSPRLAAILGWVVTDGWQTLTGSSRKPWRTVMMSVMQSTKKHLEEIEELLEMPRGNTAGGTNKDCYAVRVKRCDINAIIAAGYRTKADLPSLVTRLSPDAMEAMIDAMFKAEGCMSGPRLSSKFFAQNHGPVLDAFQILCALTNRSANINARGAYMVEGKPFMRPAGWKTEREHYKGTVWCPRTPSGTWYMRYRGQVIYTGNTFPREAQLTDFSVTRFSEALKETPRMAALIGKRDQVQLKEIGHKSYLYFRSAWGSELGEGVDADGVIFDEVDRMKDNISQAFEESLQSSPHRLVREVSTPTLPGRGVDKSFATSCQYHWFVRCTKCGRAQTIKYPDNVRQMFDIPIGLKKLKPGSYQYLCEREKCRGPLDRLRGEWVPKYPDLVGQMSGYHIPQTIMAWQDATRLMQKKIRYKMPQLWENYCLAECSVGNKTFVTEQMIDRCVAAGFPMLSFRNSNWDWVTAGIDWGQINWVTVVGRNRINKQLYLMGFGAFEDSPTDPFKAARDVADFIRPFGCDVVVADAGYGKDRCAYLAREYGVGKFFACHYNPHDKTSKTFNPTFHENTYKVLCDRTVTLKMVVKTFRDRELGLPDDPEFVSLLSSHLRALAPMVVEEDGKIYETIEKTGDDHLAHTLGYNLMGIEHIEGGSNDFQVYW